MDGNRLAIHLCSMAVCPVRLPIPVVDLDTWRAAWRSRAPMAVRGDGNRRGKRRRDGGVGSWKNSRSAGVHSKGEQWKVKTVEVVLKIEHPRETGSGKEIFGPVSI